MNIIDYKDLFKSLQQSITDYTSQAFDNYDNDDAKGLLKTDNLNQDQLKYHSGLLLHCVNLFTQKMSLDISNIFVEILKIQMILLKRKKRELDFIR